MRKFTLIAAASALALGGTGIATASQQAGSYAKGPLGPVSSLERADADGDGEISLAEARAYGAERFARMDANADGSLSKADREAVAAQRFAKTDADGNGEITPDEMAAANKARESERAERSAQMSAKRQAMMLEKLDTDQSGGLSQAEIDAAKAQRAETRGGHHTGRGPDRMARGGGRHGDMRLLREADTDKDEAVSRAEFDAAIAARFARLDTDGSGAISATEREAAMQMRRSHRPVPHGAQKAVGAGS